MTDQKTALVTGGTRGIGAAICAALKNDGFHVIANYIGNEEAAAKFSAQHGIEIIRFDVSDFDAVQTTLAHRRIDVLVNNAGITKDRMLHKMESLEWQAVMNVNLNSCFNLCRAVVGGMRDRGWGRVVNISSINGQKGQMGQTNYSAAKAGMIGFTKALALENANKGITVNAICPGYIETETTGAMNQAILQGIIAQIPVGRLGQASEVADLVAFLAGDKAAFITGATLSVNGGQYMA